MRDLFFYPFAALIISGLIFAALLPGERFDISTDSILQQGYVLKGTAFENLIASPGTSHSLITEKANISEGADVYTQMTSHLTRKDAPPSAGVFATLGRDYAQVFSGHPIEIKVIARQSETRPVEQFEMGYFAPGQGQSGWKTYQLTQDYQSYTLIYAPKETRDDDRVHYFGIWPDPEGQQRYMDVIEMSVKRVMPAAGN